MDFYTPENDAMKLNGELILDPTLKNLLIIGDSISIGYTPFVREQLNGKYNVVRPEENCGDTRKGREKLHGWLGSNQWDLIHFNWGLHDLCYRHPDSRVYGNRDKANGSISVPLDEYMVNLEQIVQVLKEHSNKLIWANTTIVPDKEAGRFAGDEVKYNDGARIIMDKAGIAINDLYSLTSSFPKEMFTCEGDVHFTKEGYKQIGDLVSEKILTITQ